MEAVINHYLLLNNKIKTIAYSMSTEVNHYDPTEDGYSIPEMSQFIAIKTVEISGIFPLSTQHTLAYKKFVGALTKFAKTILTSFPIPKRTIFLTISYLEQRWRLGKIPFTCSLYDKCYKLLTTAFIIATKYGFDNPFRMKDWVEATRFSYHELTGIEKDWLCRIQWNVIPRGRDDIFRWSKNYDSWLEYMKRTKPLNKVAKVYFLQEYGLYNSSYGCTGMENTMFPKFMALQKPKETHLQRIKHKLECIFKRRSKKQYEWESYNPLYSINWETVFSEKQNQGVNITCWFFLYIVCV